MGQFSKAYQDAVKAKELNAEWPKVISQTVYCGRPSVLSGPFMER